MKRTLLVIALAVVAISTGTAAESRPLHPETLTLLKRFVAQKEAQATAAASTNSPILPEYHTIFAAAAKGDWFTVSNQFSILRKRSPHDFNADNDFDPRLSGAPWECVVEVWGAMMAFCEGDETYATRFGHDIIDSIPPGSIYFGGTDPGRFIITAMSRSHADANPLFILSQNAFASGPYLDYVQGMYGRKIYAASVADSQSCFNDYISDARKRLEQHQLKPGEDVQLKNNRVEVSGLVAVMGVNGRLCKVIFDKNPDREFYIHESFPLDWMYPHLEPHGLIMKINRQPLPALSEAVVRKDHDYWSAYIKPMIGDWLHDDTSVADVCAFAKKTFAGKDLSGFKGDTRFVQNEYTCTMFSKLRTSIAGVYVWRFTNATDPAEKKRMLEAADLAFRQSYALCPSLPEALFGYVQLLVDVNRIDDARLLAETSAAMPSMQDRDGESLRMLIENLKQAKAKG